MRECNKNYLMNNLDNSIKENVTITFEYQDKFSKFVDYLYSYFIKNILRGFQLNCYAVHHYLMHLKVKYNLRL